ncbi:MAG TPA: hypothetical protein VGH51_03625 [Candidatus Angelobacter sp.]
MSAVSRYLPWQQDRVKLESWLDARDPMVETVTMVDNPNERDAGYRAGSRTFR